MITGCSILSKFVWWKHHDKGKTIHVSQKAVLTGFMGIALALCKLGINMTGINP